MKEVKREKFNTNNAWGFGGGIGEEITYDNGLINRKGTAYYRHMSPSKFDRWQVNVGDKEYPDFTVEIDGKKSNKVFVYKSGDNYRAYWSEKKKPFEYYDVFELVKTIEI